MNSKLHRFISILILLLLMAAPQMALAQEVVEVNSANPLSAPQGTLNLDVTIAGKGFDSSAEVLFLVTGTADTGDIVVNSVKVRGSKKIIANIDILDTAVVDDFDIEVSLSRGRGGKGTTLFKVNQAGGGGSVDPTFDVSFDGDMAGSGTDWIQPNASAKNIRYFYHDHPHIGTGEIGLSYFQDESGPFPASRPFPAGRGKNCFGPDLSTQVVMGMISQTKSGAAGVGILFVGKTEDGQITLDYDITLEGTFADRDDWTPVLDNTVILTSWRLRVAHKNERKKFSNISCVGEGTFETFIDVVRTP